jgi:hypothetical protein
MENSLEFLEIMRKRKLARKSVSRNWEHFRLLGLAMGECDPTAIRSAASALSGGIPDCEGQRGIEGLAVQRAMIAVATYRLLDPRGRESFMERVQLCYPANHEERKADIQDLDLQQVPKINPWLPSNAPQQPIANDGNFLMNRPVIDRAIQEGATNPIASQATIETKSWLEERREIVRSLQELEPAERSSSPISWIRSVLGW